MNKSALIAWSMMVIAVIIVMVMQDLPKTNESKHYCQVGTVIFEVPKPGTCEKIHRHIKERIENES